MSTSSLALNIAEKRLLPDRLLRAGIRKLLRQRLKNIQSDDVEFTGTLTAAHILAMDESALAVLTDLANDQHYEVPSQFFEQVLGPYLKYSCGYWSNNSTSIEQSESEALRRTCEHAGIKNGMQILELGCGWGSLTLWMAEKYPQAGITAVSNSHSQAEFIQDQARKKNLQNISVITSDMAVFSTQQQFDRIVSVEMFEHMRNYRKLYKQINSWLKPGGKFFKHIFVHKNTPYFFEDNGTADWMSRFFFSGGMMPSQQLPLYFQENLSIEQQWNWSGKHYAKTSNAWLERMDAARDKLWPVFTDTYGKDFAPLWWQRWRLFFMACAELFAYDNGQQWFVSHYLFKKQCD